MQDLAKFYRETILKHSVEPVGYQLEINASHENEQYNPFCGDRILVQLRIKDDLIEATAFDGEACAICMASASLLCEELAGQPIQAVHTTHDSLEQALTRDDDSYGPDRLQALMGVRRYPSRVKCVMLPWVAAVEALA